MAGVRTLLRHRPDLAAPRPADLGEVAVRAATVSSVHRALDRLNAWQHLVLEAVAAQPDPTRTEDVAALLGADPEAVATTIDLLADQALLWRSAAGLHLVRQVRAEFELWPGGLAAPSTEPLTAAEIDAAVAAAPHGGEVLRRLCWGPPTGTVRNADRPVSADSASTPVEELLAHRLLRAVDHETVILPREVALHLRGGFAPEPVPVTAPELTGQRRPAKVIEHTAAGAANEFVHDVESVLTELEGLRPGLLRTGGISIRDLGALGRRLGLAESRVRLCLEIGTAAGLVLAAVPALQLTTAFDRWLTRSTLDRWQLLATTWVDTPRWYLTEGHCLGPSGEAPWAPALRRRLLRNLVKHPLQVPDPDSLIALLRWQHPGWSADSLAVRVPQLMTEASLVGLLGMGAVSGLAAAGLGEPVPEHLTELFPAPLDSVLLQADLTAVAPGPLAGRVAAELRLFAEQESRGVGAVYRFTAASVRRGFDAGRSAEDLEQWLATHSSTGVPQPLRYLIADVARRHGTVRVGQATAYVRIDDEAVLSRILAQPGADGLGLRRIAPGVLVAAVEPGEVVEFLHGAGLAPGAEDAFGRLVRAPAPPRATARRTAPVQRPPADPTALAEDLVAQAEAVRERTRNSRTVQEELAAAVAARTPVRVDFVADDGTPVSRTLTPLVVAAGMTRMQPADGPTLAIPIARIRSVRPIGA
ncbi:helicase-associated domain-containing protein [Granulicoccus phenolivorans]|uniref:helicase-associated domain-containing protein n=1 Tax=Granulicoccus phenolivorans TaxID=266854 RepID=UPI0003FEB7AE|nr:helicase-associated domain-containing protein [Granulicoccus phenolivorans]